MNRITKHLLLCCCLLLSSCTLVDLEDMPEPIPTTAKVTLVTNWTNRSAGIDIPSSYTAVIDNRVLTFNNTSNSLPELEAGICPLIIYNMPDKITVDGCTATVTTDNKLVHNKPGWLFTSAIDVTYEVGKEKSVTAPMVQQVRQLTIELTVKQGDPERLTSVEATLSGVANAMDFKTDTYSGSNLSAVAVFSCTGDKLTAIVRLLGITGEAQKLTLKLTFSDKKEQTIESDVSSQLTAFNTQKHNPMVLSADLNTPVEAGFEATITKWKAKTGSSGIAW